MQPEELFFLVMLTVILPLTFTRMILRYKEKKREHAQVGTGAGGSLTTGELRDLVRESVEEAITPLSDRLSAVERRLARAEREEPTSRLLDVDNPADDVFEPEPKEQAKTMGRLRPLS